MRKNATTFAGISGCLAVIFGSLGAHMLSRDVGVGLITRENLRSYETAVNFQLLHSIAMIAIIALQYKFPVYFKPIMFLLMSGIVLFSGSIYVIVLGDLLGFKPVWAGPLTPIGGLCFIAAWFLLILSASKYKDKEIPPPAPSQKP